jgi:tetratricopeptide (TPR) repeat protein
MDDIKKKLSEAIALRKNKKGEEALTVLKDLLRLHPHDPDINYQMAWTCDFLGKESEAAPFYECALANGLVDDRKGAFLGLGSTYRCLGEYEKSLKIFNQAIAEFPNERALIVFRSLTLFNLNRVEESVGDLLIQLLDTTNDNSIKSYDGALRFYSDKLHQTWK